MLSLQVSHHISLLGPEALIRRCDDLPATTTHVPVAAILVLNTRDDGRLRPKHVEWLCRNKTCTVLHQVGVSFDLYYDARKHKIKILTAYFPGMCDFTFGNQRHPDVLRKIFIINFEYIYKIFPFTLRIRQLYFSAFLTRIHSITTKEEIFYMNVSILFSVVW